MSDINNDICDTVNMWLDGYTKFEYSCDTCRIKELGLYDKNMTELKEFFYDLILNELMKQLKFDNIMMIEKRLGGALQVYFDESGIIGCIVNDTYEGEGYDLDDYDDDY
jgi:hypothetical protein